MPQRQSNAGDAQQAPRRMLPNGGPGQNRPSGPTASNVQALPPRPPRDREAPLTAPRSGPREASPPAVLPMKAPAPAAALPPQQPRGQRPAPQKAAPPKAAPRPPVAPAPAASRPRPPVAPQPPAAAPAAAPPLDAAARRRLAAEKQAQRSKG